MSCWLLWDFGREAGKGQWLQPLLPQRVQREVSQDQGTGAQHSAPGGAVVWRDKWPDSWIELLMPWPTSQWSAEERSGTACSPVPSKSISRAKLVVEHPPVMFLLQLDSFPAQSHGHACGNKASHVCECAGNSPAGGRALQTLVSGWKNISPSDITMKGEEQSQISGAVHIHRSMSKHSREF